MLVINKIKKLFWWLVTLFFATTILSVVLLRFIPVFITPLMVIRGIENKSFTIHHDWVSLDEMSPHMPVAVMAGEDARFLLHHGFDYEAIGKAAKRNMQNKGGKKYGASTISQQTAKNVFLWPGRSWLRKGLEAYFTALIEMMWSKQRIMEVYLNSIEMGDRIYGLEAVAEQHFGKKASELTRSECALVAATLPNPRIYSSKSPSRYVKKRQASISNNMRYIPSFPKEGEDYDPDTAVGGVYRK